MKYMTILLSSLTLSLFIIIIVLRQCPKAYHSHCVEKNESFMTSEECWNCSKPLKSFPSLAFSFPCPILQCLGHLFVLISIYSSFSLSSAPSVKHVVACCIIERTINFSVLGSWYYLCKLTPSSADCYIGWSFFFPRCSNVLFPFFAFPSLFFETFGLFAWDCSV